jgi:hypothetical protein
MCVSRSHTTAGMSENKKGKKPAPGHREKHHKAQIETISNRTAERKRERKFIHRLRVDCGQTNTLCARVCVYWLPGRQICGLFLRAPPALVRDKKGFIGLHRLTALY